MAGTSDTPPDVEAIVVDRIRALSLRDRLRLAGELTESVRRLAAAGIRLRQPGVSDAEVREQLARQHYPKALVDAAVAARARQIGATR